jgi:aspartyl aminopeptidase
MRNLETTATILQADYHNWLQASPSIFILFEKLANDLKGQGFKQYSARTIAEVMRWHFDIEQNGEFKLNNNYVSLMARDLVKKDKTFMNFFRFRTAKHY